MAPIALLLQMCVLGCTNKAHRTAATNNRPTAHSIASDTADLRPTAHSIARDTADLRSGVQTCELHGIRLVEETMPNHGLYSVEFLPEYHEACRTRFPHQGLVFGVRDPNIKKLLYTYCPKCRQAAREYGEEQDAADRGGTDTPQPDG